MSGPGAQGARSALSLRGLAGRFGFGLLVGLSVLLLLLGIAISVGRVPVVATATAAPEPPAVDTESDCAPTDTASDPEPAADP